MFASSICISRRDEPVDFLRLSATETRIMICTRPPEYPRIVVGSISSVWRCWFRAPLNDSVIVDKRMTSCVPYEGSELNLRFGGSTSTSSGLSYSEHDIRVSLSMAFSSQQRFIITSRLIHLYFRREITTTDQHTTQWSFFGRALTHRHQNFWRLVTSPGETGSGACTSSSETFFYVAAFGLNNSPVLLEHFA